MIREQSIKRIKSIIRDTGRLEEIVRRMGAVDMEYFPAKYGAYHTDAVRRAEWLACRLRHLLYQTTVIRKPEYLLRAAEILGIKFCDRDGVFQITLPGIVFGSNRDRPTEFLYDPLYFALDEYFGSHHLTRYRRCVVCFVQIFDRESCGCVSLDLGNPELKRYLDVAAMYLLIDDSPKYMDMYHAIELGDRHAVEMFFMEPDQFPQWLHEREKNRENPAAVKQQDA